MAPTRIILSQPQMFTLRAAAEHAYPAECCGLLVGAGEDVVRVTEVVPAANIADEPLRRFMIDPQVQFDTLRRLRGGEARVIGHYHSHPNDMAQLSKHDLAMADDPDAVWVVIALNADGQARPLAAFVCPTGQEPTTINVTVAESMIGSG